MDTFAEIEIETEPTVPLEQLEWHVRVNSGLGIPFLLDRTFDMKDGPLAIVAGGPSLKSTISELLNFKNVMVVGTAHDYVISQGIKPTFAVHCDQAADLHAFQRKQKDCMYLIGTNVSPALVYHLGDCPVLLWDMEGWLPREKFNGRHQIRGGSTALTRTPALGMVVGFRDLHFFGGDSSFEDDRDRHAYDYEDERTNSPAIICRVNGRKFQTSLQFLAQAKDMQRILTHYGHLFTLEVHGDSLMRDVCEDAKINLAQFWNTRKAISKEKAA